MADFFFFGRDSSLARSIVNIQIFTHFKIFFFPFNDALAEWAKNYTLLWFVKLFDDSYYVAGKKYSLIKNFQFLRPISKHKLFTYHERQLQWPVIISAHDQSWKNYLVNRIPENVKNEENINSIDRNCRAAIYFLPFHMREKLISLFLPFPTRW